MKNSAVALLVLGAALACVAAYIVLATPDLGGPLSRLPAPTWIPLYDYLGWRLVVGGWALVGSLLLAAGWIAARDYPRSAWLGLLLYVILGPVIVASLVLAPSFLIAFVALVLGVVAAPLVTALTAVGISRLARTA